MAELRYELLDKDVPVNSFDCTNAEINKWVENSYYAGLFQQCYTYRIMSKDTVLGYYMIRFRNVEISDCPDSISDFFQEDFDTLLPSVFIQYLAIDKKYQKKKIGTYTLRAIVKHVREMVDIMPIRLITINAVADKVGWYEKEGFLKMTRSLPGQDGFNVYMYMDCIKDYQKLVEYTNEQAEKMM